MTIYKSYIGGQWLDEAGSRTAENINPANINDIIGTTHLASREAARKAVESAADAFAEWKRIPPPSFSRSSA